MKVRTSFPKQTKIVPARFYRVFSMDAAAAVSRRVNVKNITGYQ